MRDTLCGRATADTDIVVPANAVRAARMVAESTGGRCVVLDAERDVARVLWPPSRTSLDVAAWAGPTLAADLLSRDYTINAMAVPLSASGVVLSEVIDPSGGRIDLAERRVRVVSVGALDADPVRLLRGPRVAIELGFDLDPATASAIGAMAPRIAEPAAERVRDELFRILSSPDVAAAVAMLDGLGLSAALDLDAGSREAIIALSHLPLPLIADGSGLGTVVSAHCDAPTSGGRTVRELLLFAALTADASEGEVIARARALRLSAGEVRRLAAMWASRRLWPSLVAAPGDPRAIHRFFRHALDAAVDGLLLELAQPAGAQPRALDASVRALDSWFNGRSAILPTPLADGQDLLAAAGLEPGPWVRRALEAISEAQAVGEVHDRDGAVALGLKVAASDVPWPGG